MKIPIFFTFFLVIAKITNGLNYKEIVINEILNWNKSDLLKNVCGNDLLEFGENLKKSEIWALEMLDASSKIPSGIELLANDIGQFDECLRVQNENGKIFGKYCLGKLKVEIPSKNIENLIKTQQILEDKSNFVNGNSKPTQLQGLQWAVCLPNSCNQTQFQIFYNSILKSLTKGVVNFDLTGVTCSTKNDDTELTVGAIITIALFSIIFIIMLIETFYDIYCEKYEKVPKPFFKAFSMYSNSKKLFTISKSNAQLECLNGLKFYSMLWVIMGHTYSGAISSPLSNTTDLLKWADALLSMLVVSGTLSVDTFFVVGGTLVSYVVMQSMEKGKRFNIFIYYLHRYIRLTPAVGALTLFTATLYPYLGSGPYWSSVRTNQKFCQDNWWATILYIENYVSVPKLCLGHTWYLNVDTQLYILSPIILISLKKYPKISIATLIGIIIAIAGVNFDLTWNNQYEAILTNIYDMNPNLMTSFYIKTHTRAGSWILGIIVGYLISEIKEKRLKFRPNKYLNLCLWIICFAILLTCVFIGHDSLRTPEYNYWGNSLYLALNRQIWAVGISWLIVACVFGYGGPVNWFLSFPIYQIFNRFAYSIYLIHYMLITLWFASFRTTIFFSDILMGYYFWGNLCFTTIIAYFWVLAFESPIIILEKIILGPFIKQ